MKNVIKGPRSQGGLPNRRLPNRSKYTFEHTPDKLPDKCGIGWLLNNNIRDKAIEGATQNLLDFYSFKYRQMPQVAHNDFVELCNTALDAGFESILILKQGIVLNNFIEQSKDYWNNEYKDCVLVGHILDREDQWWQIHPQTLYLDLKWWQASGKPVFGERDATTNWKAPNIERSTETINDWQTYNPKWIKSINGTTDITGTWEGHNLLRVAMEQNKKVGIWDKKLRNQKEYVYGEMVDHYEKVHHIGKSLWESRWFAANTEDMDLDVMLGYQDIGAVYSTSGGLSPISNAYIRNLKAGGELVCFDVDILALHMQKYVFDNWDGTNWKQFVTEYAELNPILGNNFACMESLDDVDGYLEALGQPFIDWWNNKAKTFEVTFLEIDLMNINDMINHLNDSKNNCQNDEKVFIDCSNAFNYEINSILYSKNIRLNVENDYIKFFDTESRFVTKGFIHNNINKRTIWPYLAKLFPWQKL
mgnify:CR=1 FL=1|jgi:hypothetical protein|tara:strand:+ start:150 stop:1574 length:1425 start_codon:yes stop_codon:yes gene_type:complete